MRPRPLTLSLFAPSSLVRESHAVGGALPPGSGSTYIYGYCDSQFREGMTKEECQQFVLNCTARATGVRRGAGVPSEEAHVC